MKKLIFIWLISYNLNAEVLNLEKSFEKAIEFSKIIPISEISLQQNYELNVQNNKNIYPKLYLKGSYLIQENVAENQKIGQLNLVHTLYHGGEDKLLNKQNKLIGNEISLQKKIEIFNLKNQVINSYFNLLLNYFEKDNLKLLVDLTSKRTNEISNRVNVGKSRLGELLSAKAQLANAKAQFINVENIINEQEEKFFNLLGVSKTNYQIEKKLNFEIVLLKLEEYLNQIDKKIEIQSLFNKMDQVRVEVELAKTLNYPKIELSSNYYFLNKRSSAILKNSNWDIGVNLTFPLFEGGSTDSKISEVLIKNNKNQLLLEDKKLFIKNEIIAKFEAVKRTILQKDFLENALNLSFKSYREAEKDYRLGLISNLDLISSLNLYIDNKRNFEKNNINNLLNFELLNQFFLE